jgi:F0F1-type ATP synthase membrane subunit a
VRNDLARDVIGHDFMRFVPYLFTLFTFILTNNIFGIRLGRQRLLSFPLRWNSQARCLEIL